MSQHQILVVDGNRQAATAPCSQPGPRPPRLWDGRPVESLERALAILERTSVDAVVIAIDLPDPIDGEILRRLKGVSADTPIVVVSAHVTDLVRRDALEAGAQEVFAIGETSIEGLSQHLPALIEASRASAQHRQWERLLEATPDGILVVDFRGMVRYVNQAALLLFGRSREDFLDEWLGFSVKDGEPIEITVLRRGDERICEMRVVKIEWRREPAFLAAIRDITERRRTEEALKASEQRLRLSEIHFAAAQRIAAVGSFVEDFQSGALVGTPQFYQIFGLDPVEPGEWNSFWKRAVVEDERRRIAAASRPARRDEKPPPIEFRFVRQDGEERLALRDADLVYDASGVPTALLGVVRDVTELRRAEARTATINQELEARVKARTRQLEEANRELEAFSYSVSHDLRAPLRAIDGFSRILLDEINAVATPRARHYLDVIRASTQKMSQLIDDLLSFSQVGRQKLRRLGIDMAATARQVLAELRAAEPDRRLEVVIEPLPPGRGDPMLVRLIFQNLLENALKYSRSRDITRIEIGCTNPESRAEGEAVYFVRDNGVGFDMRFADKLFGMFQRLHPTEDYEGTGVGLAIVQRIVQRHGGKVWGRGEVGAGATFYFTLGGGGDAKAEATSLLRDATDPMASPSQGAGP